MRQVVIDTDVCDMGETDRIVGEVLRTLEPAGP